MFIFIFVVHYHKMHSFLEKIPIINYVMLFHRCIDKLLFILQEKMLLIHLLLDMIFNIVFHHKIILKIHNLIDKNIGLLSINRHLVKMFIYRIRFQVRNNIKLSFIHRTLLTDLLCSLSFIYLTCFTSLIHALSMRTPPFISQKPTEIVLHHAHSIF